MTLRLMGFRTSISPWSFPVSNLARVPQLSGRGWVPGAVCWGSWYAGVHETPSPGSYGLQNSVPRDVGEALSANNPDGGGSCGLLLKSPVGSEEISS